MGIDFYARPAMGIEAMEGGGIPKLRDPISRAGLFSLGVPTCLESSSKKQRLPRIQIQSRHVPIYPWHILELEAQRWPSASH